MAVWYAYEVVSENVSSLGAYLDETEGVNAFRAECRDTQFLEETHFGTVEATTLEEALNAVRTWEWTSKVEDTFPLYGY